MRLRRVLLLLLSLGLLSAFTPTECAEAAENGEFTPPPIECIDDTSTLLLQNSNVILRNTRWRIPSTGAYGCGRAVSASQDANTDTGHFWFFDPNNLELTCKALDGETINDHYWIFCGSLTDVEWWMDVATNESPTAIKRYYNPPSRMASFADVEALSTQGNRAPRFDTLNCAAIFSVPVGAIASISAFIEDPEGDDISVVAKLLEGEGLIEFQPQWTNPVAGTGAHVLTALSFVKPGRSVLRLEATDGRHLVASRCTFLILAAVPGPH